MLFGSIKGELTLQNRKVEVTCSLRSDVLVLLLVEQLLLNYCLSAESYCIIHIFVNLILRQNKENIMFVLN